MLNHGFLTWSAFVEQNKMALVNEMVKVQVALYGLLGHEKSINVPLA